MTELPSDKIGRVYFPLMFGGALIGALMFASDCLDWLRFGQWRGASFSGLTGFHTSDWAWRGVAKIVQSMADLNAGLVIVALSLGSIVIMEPVMNWIDGRKI